MPRIGSGAQCEKCDRDSFKEGFLSKQCTPCSPGSTAPVGTTSVHDCKCKAGKLYNSTGRWTLSSTWQPFSVLQRVALLHVPTALLNPLVGLVKSRKCFLAKCARSSAGYEPPSTQYAVRAIRGWIRTYLNWMLDLFALLCSYSRVLLGRKTGNIHIAFARYTS